MSALAAVAAAEWHRLARPRTLVLALLGAVLFGVGLTVVRLVVADDLKGLHRPTLEAEGGALLPVLSTLSYASIPVFALFVALTASGYSRGTWRTALLHEPRRWTLAGGQFVARLALASAVTGVAVVAGGATAMALAAGQGVNTDAWYTAGSWAATALTLLKVVGYVAGWGLLGTLLGAVTRSVAIGLGIGLLWAGPMENILGDDIGFAPAWFPGLLLRGFLEPTGAVDPSRVVLILAIYGVLAAAGLAVVLRRDVTS